jgi:hypothetical protein
MVNNYREAVSTANNERNEANRRARNEQAAREKAEQEQARLSTVLNKEVSGLNARINAVDSKMSGLRSEVYSVANEINRNCQSAVSRLSENLGSAVRNFNTRINEERKKTRAAIESQTVSFNRAIDSERRDRAAAVEQLGNDMRAYANNLAENLASEMEENNTFLTGLIEEQGRTFDLMLSEQKSELTEKINKNHTVIKNEMAKMDSRVAGIEDNLANVGRRVTEMETTNSLHEATASFWISAAQDVAKNIENSRHDLHYPGRFRAVVEQLRRAETDFADKAFQSALNVGREACEETLNLYADVGMAEVEWLKQYGLWEYALAETESKLKEYGELNFSIETTEGAEKVEARIDFWTNGALEEIGGDLDGLKNEMGDAQKQKIENLMNGAAKLADLQLRMECALELAREKLIESQIRHDIAADAADLLGECFALLDRDGSYVGRDERMPYVVNLKNHDTKEEITIVCEGKGKIEIDTRLPVNSAETHARFGQDAGDALAELDGCGGMSSGPLVTKRGYENRSSDRECLFNINTIQDTEVNIPTRQRTRARRTTIRV